MRDSRISGEKYKKCSHTLSKPQKSFVERLRESETEADKILIRRKLEYLKKTKPKEGLLIIFLITFQDNKQFDNKFQC